MTDTATATARARLAVPASAVAATTGAVFDEAIALTRRLKLPHISRAMAEVIPTAKAQRWEPAEVVRALLAEEAAGRDAADLRTRRTRAAFPTESLGGAGRWNRFAVRAGQDTRQGGSHRSYSSTGAVSRESAQGPNQPSTRGWRAPRCHMRTYSSVSSAKSFSAWSVSVGRVWAMACR